MVATAIPDDGGWRWLTMVDVFRRKIFGLGSSPRGRCLSAAGVVLLFCFISCRWSAMPLSGDAGKLLAMLNPSRSETKGKHGRGADG